MGTVCTVHGVDTVIPVSIYSCYVPIMYSIHTDIVTRRVHTGSCLFIVVVIAVVYIHDLLGKVYADIRVSTYTQLSCYSNVLVHSWTRKIQNTKSEHTEDLPVPMHTMLTYRRTFLKYYMVYLHQICSIKGYPC
jgi:hypothetical protein